MEQTKLKPFDLEKALSGEPVVTRIGTIVTNIIYNNSCDEYKLTGLVNRRIEKFIIDGSYRSRIRETCMDLFMAPKETTYYVNVYDFGDGNIKLGKPNKTKSCWHANPPSAEYIKTISFTIDE